MLLGGLPRTGLLVSNLTLLRQINMAPTLGSSPRTSQQSPQGTCWGMLFVGFAVIGDGG